MSDLFVKREYRNFREIEDFPIANATANSAGEMVLNEQADFLGKFLSVKKLNYFLAVILAILICLSFRSFYLQVIKGDYYQAVAETNRTRSKPLMSARGLIYDSQKQPLVKNIPLFDALIMPKDLSWDDQTRSQQLAAITQTLNINQDQINQQLQKYPKNFKYLLTVKENIDYEQALLLKIKAQTLPGLYIETRNDRQYLYPQEFSHVIGYEGRITDKDLTAKADDGYLLNDYLGKSGLEAYYEPTLRGQYGQDSVEVDVAGQEKKVLYHQDAIDGKSLVLTIDEKVQQKARQILQGYLTREGKTKGSLIMNDPQTGAILALVSLPDYDSNLFSQGISTEDYAKLTNDPNQPLFDRAVKGEYPSGSCIKPVYAAGALQEKIVTDQTAFMSTGGLRIMDKWFFPDWAAGGHGLTNVYKAIAWSVNTYFYIIGGGYQDFKGLGVDGLDKYLKLFGFGQKTGIDLPGEADGLVPDAVWKLKTQNQQWFIGDTYHLAIGQGDLLVTPLQIANYTASFANGGTLYKPYLVKEIISNDGQVQEIKPEIIRQNMVDQNNMNIVRQAMRQTVTNGSAPSLNSLNIDAAGKTGTAQWNTTKLPQAWFIGFAPLAKPQVAITVLVEEGGEGSSASVPVARDLLDWYFHTYLTGKAK